MSVPVPSSLQVSAPAISTGGNSAIAPLTVNFPALRRPGGDQTVLLMAGVAAVAAGFLFFRRR